MSITERLDVAYDTLKESLTKEQWRLFMHVEELWYQEQNEAN